MECKTTLNAQRKIESTYRYWNNTRPQYLVKKIMIKFSMCSIYFIQKKRLGCDMTITLSENVFWFLKNLLPILVWFFSMNQFHDIYYIEFAHTGLFLGVWCNLHIFYTSQFVNKFTSYTYIFVLRLFCIAHT